MFTYYYAPQFQSPSNRVNIPNLESAGRDGRFVPEEFQSPSNRVNIPNLVPPLATTMTICVSIP